MAQTDKRHATLLADYGEMTQRVRYAMLDLYRTETIIPLAIAVFYSWLYSQQGHGALPRGVLGIPVALSLLGATRQYMRYKYLECAENYLKMLERKLYPEEDELGWNGYWQRNDRSRHGLVRAVFWSLLIGMTTLVGITGIQS